MYRAVRQFKETGLPPMAGGMLDQTAAFSAAVDFVLSDTSALEAELMKKR